MTTSRQDKAGGVADEELLRLARKGMPIRPELGDDEREIPDRIETDSYGRIALCSRMGSELIEFRYCGPNNRAALHAALAVLAGEVDLQALLAKVASFCQHSDDMHQSWAIAAGEALGDNPDDSYLGGQRDILRIYASSFRKLLHSTPAEGAGK